MWDRVQVHQWQVRYNSRVNQIFAFSNEMQVDPMLNRPEWWLDWYNDGVAASEARDTWAAVYGWLESWRIFYERQRLERLAGEQAS